MNKYYDLTGSGIRRHIRRLALPAAVGLFCQTLFNMTDTFYAGYISTSAQSALAFSFPLFFILLSCCVGISQALTAQAANAFGVAKYSRATYFVGQTVVLALVISVVIWSVLIPLTADIVSLLGATGEAHADAVHYSVIIYCGAPLFLMAFLLSGVLQAMGNTAAFRNSVILSVILNVFLDPLFMFGWLGVPAMGVAGVALATVVAQFCGVIYLLMVFAATTLGQRWRWVFLRPRWRWFWQLAKQATAMTGRMFCIGLGFFIVTGFWGRLDVVAVAAYGIAVRVEQLFLLPIIGFEVAMLAYAGQNLGAGKVRNVRAAYHLCLRYGFILTAVNGVVMIFGGYFFIAMFNDDPAVISYGWQYLFLAAVVAPFYLLASTTVAVLMAAKRVFMITALSVLRLVILPFLLLSLFVGILGYGANSILVGIFLSTAPVALWMHWLCMRQLGR